MSQSFKKALQLTLFICTPLSLLRVLSFITNGESPQQPLPALSLSSTDGDELRFHVISGGGGSGGCGWGEDVRVQLLLEEVQDDAGVGWPPERPQEGARRRSFTDSDDGQATSAFVTVIGRRISIRVAVQQQSDGAQHLRLLLLAAADANIASAVPRGSAGAGGGDFRRRGARS